MHCLYITFLAFYFDQLGFLNWFSWPLNPIPFGRVATDVVDAVLPPDCVLARQRWGAVIKPRVVKFA